MLTHAAPKPGFDISVGIFNRNKLDSIQFGELYDRLTAAETIQSHENEKEK